MPGFMLCSEYLIKLLYKDSVILSLSQNHRKGTCTLEFMWNWNREEILQLGVETFKRLKTIYKNEE